MTPSAQLKSANPSGSTLLTRFKPFWQKYGFRWPTLLSGVILVFSFAPWNFYPLIALALVPWLWVLSRASSAGAAVIQGLWLNIFHALGSFYWVGFTLHEFGMLPWPVAIIGMLLFSLICQPQFPIFAPLWWSIYSGAKRPRTSTRRLGWLFLTALAYAGCDWILPKLFVDSLGHAFYVAPILRQAADLGGAWLLTFVAFTANQAVFEFVRDFRGRDTNRDSASSAHAHISSPRNRRLAQGALVYAGAAALWILTALYGVIRNHQLEAFTQKNQATNRTAQIAVIQANIGDFDKLAAENGVRGAADRIVKTYLEMSDQALKLQPKPDAMFWPETAYPSTFRTPQGMNEMARDQLLEEFVRTRRVPILFGGYDQAGGKDFNSFFLLTPRPGAEPPPPAPAGSPISASATMGHDTDLQIYHKNILLLFGEYIPGMESIRWLKEMFPQIGNFGRGPGPEVFSLPMLNPGLGELRVSPVICYEALFPSYSIEAARHESQLILNLTNDSWFGPWGEPYMHLSLTIFRSIETRLPQLRATNTGVSALILPSGEMIAKSAVYQPELMNVTVPVAATAPWTLMKAWGDWFGTFAVILGLFPMAFFVWRARRRSAR